METATFGAGCFWGVEFEFRQLEGVLDAPVGYMGGSVEDPSYEQVSTGKTGHVEVCQVTFDPERISYKDLLKVFFEMHDPTQINRQGPDIGWQYRSVIFYNTEQQKNKAEKMIEELNASGKYEKPLATKVEPEAVFYRAEEYHQKYFEKTGLRVCH